MNDSPCNTADWQPSPEPDFHRNIPILRLPAEHVSVLHGRATVGHVSIATLDSGWSERAIPVEDLPRYLEAVPVGVNVYLSQARFRGWRRTQLLSSVNALWVDVDHYKAGHRWSDAQALCALLRACDEGEPALPAPSYVIASGRGLAAVWLVEVLPREALPRWQALEMALVDRLDGLGVDRAARDVTRVLRLAGTLHTKAARLVRCLYPEVGAPKRYGFDELCGLLLPYSRPELSKSKGEHKSGQPAQRVRTRPRAARLVRLAGADAKLWADRLADLDRLLELRWFGELPPGQRDFWMLLGACALSWMIPPGAARRETRMLAIRAIGGDWGQHEIDARMGTVLRRAEAAGRGEVVVWQGIEVDPRYRYRTGTILDVLQISADEQREMRTLIGLQERARRRSEHQVLRGAKGGVLSGERRRETNRERDADIIELHAAGWSNRAIARELGIYENSVRHVLKRVRNEA